ncbi:hypothetical protein [Kistimonas asteriae]|uniref:hypothetical protein n=1 Tax=Kistimonas asteriae TaxID=517724 RepID=UPI001BABF3A1|nr:hypothetical protein [Kistimonas asteriae]
MKATATPSSNYFYGPVIDFLLVGGMAFIIYLTTLAFLDFYGSFDLWYVTWCLAFLVNFPHFMISYQIFYRYHRNRITTDKRFFMVGVVVPVILMALSLAAVITQDGLFVRILIHAMFFFVGWHYVKQCFGCFILTSSNSGTYYQKTEIILFKTALYLLWVCSYVQLFRANESGFLFFMPESAQHDFWGVKYSYFSIPGWIGQTSVWLAIISFAICCGLIARRAWLKEKLPNHVAIMGFMTAYLWLAPVFYNPKYAYIIPFFHSLQYLMFSGVYMHNKIERHTAEARKRYWVEQARWWGLALLFGALFFEWLPSVLDESISYDSQSTGTRLFYVLFTLFINVHHYFIDSVIWKGDNQEVREHLKPVAQK